MDFQQLHEGLRLELVRRIDRGLLTGTLLARQAGFRQAHMSNFLNRKRSLSLEGLDRVLKAQNLTIEQILPIDPEASVQPSPPNSEQTENIPVVSHSAVLHETRVAPSSIIETIQVSASRLHSNRAAAAAPRSHWQRFLALRVDAQQAAPMEPVLSTGSIAVLDRHYNSLAPYSAHQPTLYAVRAGNTLVLRYLALEEDRLILRPYRLEYPLQLLPITPGDSPSDHIVGRVCMLFSEL